MDAQRALERAQLVHSVNPDKGSHNSLKVTVNKANCRTEQERIRVVDNPKSFGNLSDFKRAILRSMLMIMSRSHNKPQKAV